MHFSTMILREGVPVLVHVVTSFAICVLIIWFLLQNRRRKNQIVRHVARNSNLPILLHFSISSAPTDATKTAKNKNIHVLIRILFSLKNIENMWADNSCQLLAWSLDELTQEALYSNKPPFLQRLKIHKSNSSISI